MVKSGCLACLGLFLAGTDGLLALEPAQQEIKVGASGGITAASPATVRVSGVSVPQTASAAFTSEPTEPIVWFAEAGFRDGYLEAAFTSEPTEPIVWGQVDYVLWWLSSGSTPPLVSTGNPADTFPGALGQPGTQVLFGGPNALDYAAFSGLRATIGGWLTDTWGFELSGFFLGQRSVGFAQASDPLGNPPIYVPFNNFNPLMPPTPHEGSFTVADPLLLGGVNGNIAVAAALQFWGAEANARCRGFWSSRLSVDWLLGFRYLELDEDLALSGSHKAFLVDIQQSWQESFATRNNFYGGQVGARAVYWTGRLSLDFAGKLAMGNSHQVVTVSGSSTEAGAGSANPGNFPGGAVFALPSNLGRQSHTVFAVVPHLQVKAGYNLTNWMKGFAGYDFLFWSSVVRVGDQIDRNSNGSQAIGGTLIGDPVPTAQFNRSGFFAHGLTFGMELRY